jgi:glutamate racemase
MFVPLVEEGWAARPEARSIAAAYLRPLRARKIDTLILGCTHYPFLRAAIRAALPAGVKIVDPARETAEAFARFLEANPALDAAIGRKGVQRFFVSDKTAHAAAIASRWLGERVELERVTL